MNSSPGQALLLADDLTGACDSGLAFAKVGFAVSVLLRTGEQEINPRGKTQFKKFRTLTALSTDARNMTAEEAAQQLTDLKLLRNFDGSLLFHKVDSAGRGHSTAEMCTIAQLARCDSIVYAPAFPENGRVVHNSILSVRDVCGQNTEIPLLSLFDESLHTKIALIATAPDDLTMRHRLSEARNHGKTIWLCDAEQPKDLERIARVAFSLNRRLLWSGSGGLAAAVAALLKTDDFHRAKVPTAALGCTLVVCGTPHPVTQMQIKHLASETVTLTYDSETKLKPKQCGFLKLSWDTSDEAEVRRMWSKLHHKGNGSVCALVLTGGDTAAFFLKALGTTEIALGGEVEAGIPWGIVQDGMAHGCLVVTKSGGFGTEFTLRHIVEFCRKGQG
jgi:D-threonate/D-erythronate kinase